MKHLAEIYIDIDRQCNESNPPISLMDESAMLLKASEEYVENLLKIGERWESVLRYDLDSLKASEKIRGSQKGFILGAEVLMHYVTEELKRYGISISEGVHFGKTPSGISVKLLMPDWRELDDEIKKLFKYEGQYIEFKNGCFKPNGEVKELTDIMDLYNTKRHQVKDTLEKGVATKLYKFFISVGLTNKCKRTLQREIERLNRKEINENQR